MIKCVVNTSNRTINIGNYSISPKDVIYLSEDKMSTYIQQQLNNLSKIRVINVTDCIDESNINELDGEPVYRSIKRAKPIEENIEDTQEIVVQDSTDTIQEEVIETKPKTTKRKTKRKVDTEE